MKASILVVEDDVVLNSLLVDQLSRMGFQTEGRQRWKEAEKFIEENEPDLVILDYRLPDADGIALLPKIGTQRPVIILTAHATVENAVTAIKNGAAEYLVKPVNLDELEVVVRRALETAALKRENQFFKSRMATANPAEMIGASRALGEINRLINAVATSDMTVLIQGESGVGKELVANAIHARSHRAQRNFIAVDCCTLQKHLFESELFGHEKGSFTGADRQKKGLIEGAAGGTLFLDEIGEIEPAMQGKLLRVLETGRFRRLGGTRDIVADVRVVAATNRDLVAMSKDGSFRSDLYYRLNAFAITAPPLRERREDIKDLAAHFIRSHGFKMRVEKTFTSEALRGLEAYDWPGNIRELKNVVERAIILSGDTTRIGPEHLAIPGIAQEALPPFNVCGVELNFSGEPSFDEIRRCYVKYLLEKYNGHRAQVAKVLGISERNTYRLIQRYEL
jgi:DNA-binding NtrC family response regulator